MNIILMHGLEGSPEGNKAKFLRQRYPSLVTPDGRGKPLAPRIELLRAATATGADWLGIGSSYGGLALTSFVQTEAQRFRALLLLAPALMWREAPVDDPSALLIPKGLPAIVLHGVHDSIVPLALSHELAARSGEHVKVVELDDDHALRNSMTQIADAVASLTALP